MAVSNDTLKYTGHPFVDVGVAVLESHLRKSSDEMRESDLEIAARWLLVLYGRKDLKGYLTVHFPNSAWVQPAITESKKSEYIRKVLHSYDSQPLQPGRNCSFCGRPAQVLADRQHVPMLTGTTLLVTAPGGVPGLPVCGYCLFSVQFYPLATLKVAGRPLFWWAPDPDLTSALVEDYHGRVMQQLSGSFEKFPNLSWAHSRLLESAQEVLGKLDPGQLLTDCIGYHVTNYGSGPDFDQYVIPKALLEFWIEVRAATQAVREAHRAIEEGGWEVPTKRGRRGKSQEGDEADSATESRRNRYYEALGQAFKSPDWGFEARKLIPRFFVHKKPEQYDPNSFALSALFLTKVGGMERQRLDVIKVIADRITEVLVLGNNEKHWLRDLYLRELRTPEFLNYLVRAQKRLSEFGQAYSLDDVLTLLDLTSTEDSGPRDAWLVRDLFLIRMLELVGERKKEFLADLSSEATAS